MSGQQTIDPSQNVRESSSIVVVHVTPATPALQERCGIESRATQQCYATSRRHWLWEAEREVDAGSQCDGRVLRSEAPTGQWH